MILSLAPRFLRLLHPVVGILLVLSFVQAGCVLRADRFPATPVATVTPASPSVLVLSHAADRDGVRCLEQVRQTLAYAKIPYMGVDLAAPNGLPPLDAYRAVVVATERLDALSIADARRLLQYVQDGGGLAALIRGWHPMLGPAFGRPTAFAPPYMLVPDEQFVLHGHLMPGTTGLTLSSLSLSMLDFEAEGAALDTAATVLATAQRSGRPLAWFTTYGRGRTIFWNTAQLTFKSFRGVIIQSIAVVQGLSVRALANWGTIYLDDFPNPAASSMMEPIASELSLSAADFYATRWYPDMRRLAAEFGLAYTSTIIFTYNGASTPPYRFHEWLMGRVVAGGTVVYYSPWIARQEARFSEMALHGYNHQPLTLANWTSQRVMTQALTAARQRWLIDDLAPLPTTYVPPMNRIDSTGMRALRDVFPSLTTIAGFYGGDFSLGQDREFGPDPWAGALYALPRNTDGYIRSDPLHLSMASLLEVLGAWGHFLHPDEVYPNEDRYHSMRKMGVAVPDDPEKGFQWYGEPAQDGLYYRFREWLTFARTQYPWLRYMTAQDAASTMKSYEAMTWRSESSDGSIEIHTSHVPAFFVVHAPPNAVLADVQGADVLHRTETVLLTKFVIQATSPRMTLHVHDSTYVSSDESLEPPA